MGFCNICFQENSRFEIEALCDDCWGSLNEWIGEKVELDKLSVMGYG